ncbi:MAG: GNAT family N-acetyltransferase [Saprospiraceae bacterium]|nr:GNAT family N-acetyltransferase [Saprospiraceae bacterium]
MDTLFETKRVRVRRLILDDLDGFYDMQSNANVMQFIKPTQNYEESKLELKKFIQYYSDKERFFRLWALDLLEDQTFFGICGVYDNPEGEKEIAYRIREQFWRRGFGSEVAKGLINYCRQTLQLKHIVAYADERNTGSIHILEELMHFTKRIYSEKRNRYSIKYELSEPKS